MRRCGVALNVAESPQADAERAYIRRADRRGQDKQQIKDALVAEYGDNVLALPKARASTSPPTSCRSRSALVAARR